MPKKLTPLPQFVIDAGNAFVKYVVGDTEAAFVHKVAQLMPHDYEAGQERFGKNAPLDFLRIGGESYAVGATAENYRVQHRVGAPKYQRDYYGALFASAVARVFAGNPSVLSSGLRVVASHASRDYEYRKELIKSIKGRWRFECGGVKFDFEVTDVRTYEEPFGGYARRAFVQDRRGNWTTPLHGKEVGIIDIGGGKCGVLVVDENGVVQYGRADSGEIGMNDAQENLRNLLKREYTEHTQRGREIDDKRLRRALATGVFAWNGHELQVEKLVQFALAPLLNEVETMYTQTLGGGQDVIILTGGGNAVLHERVMERIGHGNVILAEDAAAIQFANVRGARDFTQVLEEVV